MSVEKQEQQVLNSVHECHRKDLENLEKEYWDIFPKKLPNGAPPLWEVQYHIKSEQVVKPLLATILVRSF